MFLVLGRHFTLRYPADGSAALRTVMELWNRAGWIGVDLFFVLSGFLISGLLFREQEREGDIRVSRFLIRRGFKIYPPFYLMLIVSVLFLRYLGRPPSAGSVFSEAVFMQSYFAGIWGHTWSLAVEEHFYLLLPLGLIWLRRRKLRGDPFPALPWVFLMIAVSCLALRTINWIERPYQHQTHLFPSHLRIDSLFFGVALSHLYHFDREAFVRFIRVNRTAILIASAVCILPSFVLPLERGWFIPTLGLTGLYLGFGGILCWALLWKPGSAPGSKLSDAVAAVGARSYSIYLWHLPLMTWFVFPLFFYGKVGYWGALFVYVAGSIAFGMIMATAVEFPALLVRDRFFPSRSGGAL